MNDTTPYWSTSATFPQFARLGKKGEADVVVGGGITGLTAARRIAAVRSELTYALLR